MERRQFIRKSCGLCIGLASATVFTSLLTSCTPLPIYNTVYIDKQITVPLTQFLTTNFVIVRCENIVYDIALIKYPDGNYKSFAMQCTHADNKVDYNGKEFSCSLHGSIFSNNGQVKRGPAEKPLATFKSTVEGENVLISL